jgi:hypothetical protein
MKRTSGKTLNLNRTIISIIVIAAILLVYNSGMPFTEIWEGTFYKVNAEESPLKVEFYNSNRGEYSTVTSPNFRITNVSPSEINLKDVKIRYYYTLDSLDSEEVQTYSVYTSQKAGEDIIGVTTGTFVKMSMPTDTADYYLEIGFNDSAGTIEQDGTVIVGVGFSKEKIIENMQTNDYSYNGSAENYTLWDKVTVYIANQLVSGIEPNMYASRQTGAWYMFDDTVKNLPDQSKDYRGNYGNAVLNSGAGIVPGRNGNGLSLDGVDDFVTLPAGITNLLYNFTIATWVKVDAVGNGQAIFDFSKENDKYMRFTVNNDGKVKVSITESGESQAKEIVSDIELSPGVWKHVAMVLAGSTGILYIDGVEVGRNSSITIRPSKLLGTTASNYIGKSRESNSYFGGMIDDFQIFNRALSANEVRTLAGTVTKYEFDSRDFPI